MALRSASVLLSAAALARASVHAARQEQESSLTWSECEFKHQFDYTNPIECSSLEVPLDYTDESNEVTLNLDLVKIKASNEPVLGILLFNPGGPGSSGIDHLFGTGAFLGSITNGQYDLVSFDPRGTGRNKPFACANETAKAAEKRQEETLDLPRSNLTALLEASWPEYLQQAEICGSSHPEDGAYYGTIAVARDMARILDALGGDGLLRYYGVSYGTLLGWTFAATFPERVDRLIIDGNINPMEYWSGYDIESVDAMDGLLEGFIEACVKHPDTCELAAVGDAETISTELNKAFDVEDKDKGALALLKNKFLTPMYRPSQYPQLAKYLAALIKDGPDAVDALIMADQEKGSKGAKADETAEEKWAIPDPNDKAKQAITCGDWPLRASGASEVSWLLEQQSVSSSFVESIAFQYWDCLVWPFEAAERYEGDFNIETKSPVLVANSRYDPVTPLKSARNSSSTLVGSVLLETTGFGHGTSVHMSNCALEAMRTYMVEGTLPDEGTICEPEQELFDADFDGLSVLKPFLEEAKMVLKEGEVAEEPEVARDDTAASPTEEAAAEPTVTGSSASTLSFSVTAVIGTMLLGISFLAM